jgi:transcriptional regulator with XRE-family HTH domain
VKEPGTNAQRDRERDLARGAYLFRVTEDILVAMEDQGVSKAELAQRLGKSKARISQLLGGSSNMTIGTLAEIAFVLGLTLDKTFKEYSEGRHWVTEEQVAALNV